MVHSTGPSPPCHCRLRSSAARSTSPCPASVSQSGGTKGGGCVHPKNYSFHTLPYNVWVPLLRLASGARLAATPYLQRVPQLASTASIPHSPPSYNPPPPPPKQKNTHTHSPTMPLLYTTGSYQRRLLSSFVTSSKMRMFVLTLVQKSPGRTYDRTYGAAAQGPAFRRAPELVVILFN